MFNKLSYSQKKYWKNQAIYYLIGIWLFLILYFSVKGSIESIIANKNNYIHLFWLGCLISGLFIGKYSEKLNLIFFEYLDKILDKIGIAKNWIDWEKLVYEKLKEILNSSEYKIYKNVKIPWYDSFDIDFVILWPKRLIILEVKNHSNQIHFFEDHFETTKRKNQYKREITEIWKKGSDPRKKVTDYWEHFSNHLQNQHFGKLKINKALVYTKDVATWEKTNWVYIVSGINDLEEYIKDQTFLDEKITPSVYDKLDKLLSKISL